MVVICPFLDINDGWLLADNAQDFFSNRRYSRTMSRPASRSLQRLALVSVGLALLVPAGLSAVFLAEPDAPPVRMAIAKRRTAIVRAAPPPPVRVVEPKPVVKPDGPVVASVIKRPDAFDYGAWLWKGDAPGGGPGAGPVVVTVDLRAQLLRVWRGGHEIGVSTILYGAPDSPTPLGVFPITQKDADHVSNIFGSPMPYSLRLTSDGVMVHASNVRSGWASNGCVGLPKDFARQLFGVVKLGDKVVITDGKPLVGVGDALPVV